MLFSETLDLASSIVPSQCVEAINYLPRRSMISSYIFYSRSRIDFELPLTFAQKILNRTKIFLVQANAFPELSPIHALSAGVLDIYGRTRVQLDLTDLANDSK